MRSREIPTHETVRTARRGALTPELGRRVGAAPRIELGDGGPLCVAAGRLVRTKGFEYLIDALAGVQGIGRPSRAKALWRAAQGAGARPALLNGFATLATRPRIASPNTSPPRNDLRCSIPTTAAKSTASDFVLRTSPRRRRSLRRRRAGLERSSTTAAPRSLCPSGTLRRLPQPWFVWSQTLTWGTESAARDGRSCRRASAGNESQSESRTRTPARLP